ncbi:MAG: archaellin/type IV pilin N-terminal domain-containing protein [Candidatus Bathyarchaeia archaeon]|jgi:flagellin-like protein
MRKLLKNKKALSPVVAAIILIAVTVAVSIAVAAWMGQLTFNFMETETAQITAATIHITADDVDTIELTIMNTGTTDIAFSSATITGGGTTVSIGTTSISYVSPATSLVGGTTGVITLTTADDIDFVTGTPYSITILTSKGNGLTYTETA